MNLPAGVLAAYFDRIGWAGPVAPDRATLAAIAAHHPAAIPFENLDPLLGRPVDLSWEALVAKLIHGGRGGYCFEHNGLLRHVLETIGFRVTGLAARVLWNRPDGEPAPRTHMLLRVDLDEGSVLIDVGFGGAVPTGVLDLVPDVEQRTPHEPFRLVRDGAEWLVQIRIGEEWRPTYRFDLTPQHPIDYELGNWWTSANPRSHFRNLLTVARAMPGCRLVLGGQAFAVHPLGGTTERRTLSGPAETCDVLESEFGIRLPDRAALEKRICHFQKSTAPIDRV